MKKKYEAPVAEMVGFDYEENVVASGTPSQGTKCPTCESAPSQGTKCSTCGSSIAPTGIWWIFFWYCR